MGLGKIIAAVFALIFILLIVIGIDGYMTYSAFSELSKDDISSLVSNPQYEVGTDNKTITISVDVNLPKAGFIPKGVLIKLIVSFNDVEQSQSKTVSLGDKETFSLSFTMTDANAQILATGGSLTVKASAEATPVVVGYPIDKAMQTIDLGTTSVKV